MYIYVKFLPGNLNISICPPPYLTNTYTYKVTITLNV